MTDIDGRCPCTLADVGNGVRKKPLDGYIEPDPNCTKCQGTGKLAFRIPGPGDPDFVASFFGRCPVCGEENGFHIQLKGTKSPIESGHGYACINPDCENEWCEWIKCE